MPLKNCDLIVSWKVQFNSSMEGLFEEQNSWDVLVKAETVSVECFCSLERLASPWTALPPEQPASAFSTCPGSFPYKYMCILSACVCMFVFPCAQYGAILAFVFIRNDSWLKFLKEKRL